MDYINIVNSAIENADNNVSGINPEILKIKGMSSPKIRHFLNNVCHFDGCKYLEIGSHRGSTFCSAINNNKTQAVSIDDFSGCANMLGPFPHNELTDNINKYKTESTAVFINRSCWNVKLSEKFNVYFYDANHEEQYQYKAFTYFNDVLEDEFIAIVDDYRNDFVKRGTQRAFKDLKYNIVREWEKTTAIPNNDNGWWNGIYVAIIKK